MIEGHPSDETLQTLADETLEEAQRPIVAAHVRRCEACRVQFEYLVRLRAAIAGLRREIEPPTALWSRIESRTTGRGGSSRLFRVLAAAAVLLLVVGGLSRTVRTGSRPGSLTATDGGSVHPAAALDLALVDLERRHRIARTELTERIRGGPGSLPEDSRIAVEAGIERLDQAVAEVQLSLDRTGDPRLARRMISLRRQQMALLERAARLTTPNREEPRP